MLISCARRAAKLAERDERLALARHRVHAADGLEEALDEEDAEREPRARQLAERRRRHPEHPPRARAPGRREVAARRVPGVEAAGPHARAVHRHHDDGFFAAGLAHQVDAAVHEHPPRLGGLALVEQLHAFVEADLLAGREELGELLVGERLEEEERAQVVDVHQIVAR